jgi:hypothetical protein
MNPKSYILLQYCAYLGYVTMCPMSDNGCFQMFAMFSGKRQNITQIITAAHAMFPLLVHEVVENVGRVCAITTRSAVTLFLA